MLLNRLWKKIKSHKWTKAEFWFMGLIIGVIITALFASLLQSNFGRIDIEYIKLVDEYGNTITGKLFRPKTATFENPAPGILVCHGMNNDKETEFPVSLELAKQGMVVIAVDQQNHGDSDIGMDVVGNFLGSATSNENDTLGADAMYRYLETCAFVDASKIGLIGHSMGGSTVRTLAKLHPDHDAIVIQAGGPDNLTEIEGMNNYLDIWPLYEELFINPMESRAEFVDRGKSMIEYNLDLIGESPTGEYIDQNYGNFSAGTAQRYALCKCTHPGATWNRKSIRESVAWMMQALQGETIPENALSSANKQTYQLKETLTLLSLLFLLASLIPFGTILMYTPYFKDLKYPLPEEVPLSQKEWWKTATINTGIGGLTYIFLPIIGMIAGGVITIVFPVFRLLTGNGVVLWLLINAWICNALFKRWYKRNQSSHQINLSTLGLFETASEPQKQEKYKYLGKSFLLTTIFFGYLYVMITFIQQYLQVEARFMWPVLKQFTPLRFALFFVYLLPVYVFFKVNGGKFMFGQLKLPQSDSSLKTQLIWWFKYLFAMEAGLFLIFCIQYLPMFIFKTGPGISFGPFLLFFGLFGIFLMQNLPQFAVMFILLIVFYHKTGKIYVGSYTVTMLITWILAVSGQLV